MLGADRARASPRRRGRRTSRRRCAGCARGRRSGCRSRTRRRSGRRATVVAVRWLCSEVMAATLGSRSGRFASGYARQTWCVDDASPTARALLVLELIQAHRASPPTGSPTGSGSPTAPSAATSRSCARPASRSSRRAGRYGGYRVGRGMRLPPLMFTATEALGLVMAVLEGHHDAAEPDDPVGQALGKIVRALPEPLAGPADAVRRVPARGWDVGVPDVGDHRRAGAGLPTRRRVRLRYGIDDGGSGRSTSTRGRWSSATGAGTCWAGRTPRTPAGCSASTGCARVEVLAETVHAARRPRRGGGARGAALAGLEVRRRGRDRGPGRGLRALAAAQPRPARGGRRAARPGWSATTDEPDWYAAQLADLPMAFRAGRVARGPRGDAGAGRRLLDAASP